MKNKFYSHILTIEPINNKLMDLEVSEEEKAEILNLLHSHIHITVIDVILTELDEGKKKEFLHLVGVSEEDSGVWDFVLAHIEKGDEKVKKAIDKIVADFVEDLDNHSY